MNLAASSAATPNLASGVASTAAAGSVVPCGVSKVLVANCQTCHAAKPIGGAPMPLVTYDDLQKQAVTVPNKKVYELVQQRIHDTMRPMPPSLVLSADDMSVLDNWLTGGAMPGPTSDAQCAAQPSADSATTAQKLGTGGLTPKEGETCYEFPVHQSTTEVDKEPYDVGDGEHYEQFYYEVPWPKDTVSTGYATVADNVAVLHHWILFATDELDAVGSHKTSPYPTLIGVNPQLLAGWAVGGPPVIPPDDVGFELPDPGKAMNVQWHFYNSTGKPQKDGSRVQICTVPKSARPHLGSVTWLGTEDLNGNKYTGGAGMPPHQESTFKSDCLPGRQGLAATEPIHIIGFEPHMHRIGKRMTTAVVHADGTTEMVFDKPFSFGNETHYFTGFELAPGDKLHTECSFNNTNDFGVPFGESSDSEMCYQFAFHWPAHTLSNGAFSFEGVGDTCW